MVVIDEQEIRGWAQEDKNRWELRNNRFMEDQQKFELEPPGDLVVRNQKDLFITSYPKTIAKKIARLVARHPGIIELDPAPEVEPELTQRIENLLYKVRDGHHLQHATELNLDYEYQRALLLLLRGWSVERVTLNPDFELSDLRTDPHKLWDHVLFDAANVYPYAPGGRLVRVTHTYMTTYGVLKYDPFYREGLEKTYQGSGEPEDADRVELTAVYWWEPEDKEWWHSVLVGEEYAKKPAVLGYNPWVIVIADGAPYRETPWDDYNNMAHQRVGASIYDETRDVLKQIDRIVTRFNEMLSGESNPAVSFFTDDKGLIKTIEYGPGARNFFAQRDKVEVHRTGPNPTDFQIMWNIVMDQFSKATLPDAFWGGGDEQSALQHAGLMSAGRDVLYPWVTALNNSDMIVMRKKLELYRDFGPADPFPVIQSQSTWQKAKTHYVGYMDIIQQGVQVRVVRDDMTPQDQSLKVSMGLAAVNAKAISMKRFRGDSVAGKFFGIKDPQGEDVDILSEQVYQSPEVVKGLVGEALLATGRPMLLEAWNQLGPQNQPQEGSGPPAGPGGQGGLPPAAAIPGQGPSQTGPAVPPVAANPALAQPNTPDENQIRMLQALLAGPALGGPGTGGVPPPPERLLLPR